MLITGTQWKTVGKKQNKTKPKTSGPKASSTRQTQGQAKQRKRRQTGRHQNGKVTEGQAVDVEASRRHVGADEELDALPFETVQVGAALLRVAVAVQAHAAELILACTFQNSVNLGKTRYNSVQLGTTRYNSIIRVQCVRKRLPTRRIKRRSKYWIKEGWFKRKVGKTR